MVFEFEGIKSKTDSLTSNIILLLNLSSEQILMLDSRRKKIVRTVRIFFLIKNRLKMGCGFRWNSFISKFIKEKKIHMERDICQNLEAWKQIHSITRKITKAIEDRTN